MAWMSGSNWEIEDEILIWDALKEKKKDESGLSELKRFEFGLPSAISIGESEFMATFWCMENGRYGVKWIKLSIRD